MSEKKATQSITISGGKNSNIQVGGIAEKDLTINQTQQIGAEREESQLTQADVAGYITQLKNFFQSSGLPENQAYNAIQYMDVANDEVKTKEPDKNYVAKSLKRAIGVFKETGETVEVGSNLYYKIKPILKSLASWLGIASNFIQ